MLRDKCFYTTFNNVTDFIKVLDDKIVKDFSREVYSEHSQTSTKELFAKKTLRCSLQKNSKFLEYSKKNMNCGE